MGVPPVLGLIGTTIAPMKPGTPSHSDGEGAITATASETAQ